MGPTRSDRTTEREASLVGTVSYRERMALPQDAVVQVWMTDMSPGTPAVPAVAETAAPSEGRQVPIPFELRYDPSRIEADHEYGINAVIKAGGRTLFHTEAPFRVIPKGTAARVDLWLTRAPDEPARPPRGLWGTAWRLTDLGGSPVLNGVEATLEFHEVGKVSGNGSCNRFFGGVEITGESIKFGPLGMTLMACDEAVMEQEGRFFRALGAAERFARDGPELLIYYRGAAKPVRFIAKES